MLIDSKCSIKLLVNICTIQSPIEKIDLDKHVLSQYPVLEALQIACYIYKVSPGNMIYG